MSIFTLKDSDIVEMSNDEIRFEIGGKVLNCAVSEIIRISILTTDQGPFVDDVALAIAFDESIFVIPSQHCLYDKFLFDEISKQITIDFQGVIDASSCTDNAEFILYSRG